MFKKIQLFCATVSKTTQVETLHTEIMDRKYHHYCYLQWVGKIFTLFIWLRKIYNPLRKIQSTKKRYNYDR